MSIASFCNRKSIYFVAAGSFARDQTDIRSELLCLLKTLEVTNFDNDRKRCLSFDAKKTAEFFNTFPICVLICQFFDSLVKAFHCIGKFIVSYQILIQDLFIETVHFEISEPQLAFIRA